MQVTGEGGMRCVVPVVEKYNSIYLQAQMWASALSRRMEFAAEVMSAAQAARQRLSAFTIYHYGSFDLWAFRFAYRKDSLFVFHNVTAPKYLWRWSPLVALRAIAAEIQLTALPRRTKWVAVSEFNRDVLLRKGFRDVQVVPCMLPPQKSTIKTQHPTLLFVGRISPSKDPISLLDCYEHLVRGNTNAFPSLVIVGTAKPRCRYARAFEKRFREVRRYYPVTWHRYPIAYSDLQDLYGRCWLYISTSRHEGFGIPVLEAITAGTPAIYMRCGGTESVLRGEGCATSLEMLVQSIRLHIENPAERVELLERQRRITKALTSSEVTESLIVALEPFLKVRPTRSEHESCSSATV